MLIIHMFIRLYDRRRYNELAMEFRATCLSLRDGEIVKCGSERYNKQTCRLVLHAVAFDAKHHAGKL